jgi:ATP-binding cassette, subfamily C (CFTR/MRP), member 1
VLNVQASSDLSILDFDIPYSMAFVTTGSIEVVTTILVMGTVTWQVLVVAVPICSGQYMHCRKKLLS